MSLLNKILFTPQTLTDDQKRIARENIGAAAAGTELYFDENTISGDGSQAHPYNVKQMEAATAQANGKGGIVPAPVGGDDNFDKRVLCSNGEWNPLIPVTNAEIDEMFIENVVKIGGRNYSYVKIGNQLWLTENLKYDGIDHILNSDGEYFYYISTSLDDILPEGWRIPYASDLETLVNTLNPDGVNKCSAINTGYSDWDRYAIGGSGLNFYPYGYNTNGEQGFRSVGTWASYVGRDRFGRAKLIYISFANSWNYTNYNGTEKGNIRLVKDIT